MNSSIYPFIPFVRTHMTTENIMFVTILALLPSAGYGMYLYGLHAALLMGICVVTAVAAEAVFSLTLRRGLTILDYSAVVTGLIGGMLLPAGVPYYYAVILALAAMISKAAFGGIGRNILNPAALGKVLLLLVFRSAMGDFSGGEYGAVGALTLLSQGEEITLGTMLVGHTAGPIGTGSAVTILIGAVVLLLIGVTDIYIPLAYIASFSVLWVFIGGYGLSPYHLAIQLAGGGFLFTAFYMAQDNTTSPMSRRGKVLYGILLGVLTAILRRVGVLENAAVIALLAANVSVRWLDTKTLPVTFGVDATVRRVRRSRERRRQQPDSAQAVADSASGYQEFEEHVVPKGAMDGSETAGTINADSIESFHNRRAVTYDTASIDHAEVRRQLRQQNHAMRQSMPIFGENPAPAGQTQQTIDPQQMSSTQAAATQDTQAMAGAAQNVRNEDKRRTRQNASAQQAPDVTMNYTMPTYANGQPMYDPYGNPLPLLDMYGNPVLDAYGNMIWGQPMQMPQQYMVPEPMTSSMPIYGQSESAQQGRAATGDPGKRSKKVSQEPVSRDTDFLEVAQILEAARAREQQEQNSALSDVQYMDLSSGFSSPEIQEAASHLEGKAARKRNQKDSQ